MGLFKRKKKEQKLCPNCRKPVPDGSAFCDSCGLRVSPPPTCAKCNLPLAPDTNFCEACGTPVGTASESPPADLAQPELHQKKRPSKDRRAKKKAPEKDEFVDPAMLVAKKDEPETPAVTPAAEEELMEEPETTPAPRSSGITVYGPTFFPALSRVPKRTLAVAGIAILCLILTAAVLIGLVHLPSPSFLQDIGTPTGTTPAIVAPDPSDATTRTTPQGVAPASPSLVPGPTQVLPESYRIWLQADRDPITSMVTVIYNGGKGQRAVREIQVRLTRSDGQVLTQVFRPLTTGEGAELQGTKYTDRLEVNITYNNGDSFTVIDRIFPYKQRN